MEVIELKLAGLKLVKPKVFSDDRGFFLETYSAELYGAHGMDAVFVQDNHSSSQRSTLRGLHYQSTPGQAKLLRVVSGRIFDVAVDIRRGSPTFGQWEGVYLDAQDHQQLYIPNGFAHGFCVTSEKAEVCYKVSSSYNAKTESTIMWNDPTIGVAWPVTVPLLSARDQSGESFGSYRARVSAAL